MIQVSSSTKLFICQKPVDFRFGFDRLAHLCEEVAGESPYGGNLFLFFNRAKNRARILFFDGSGSCMLWKRLEAGKYVLPKSSKGEQCVTIAASSLSLLLEGAGSSPWKPGR